MKLRSLTPARRAFGQVKKVRLPKKMNGQHRGFGFVEFLTHDDAAKCLKDLYHTHFYGRHLVIEWASSETESLEALREKAAKQVKRQIAADHAAARTKRIELDEDAKEDDE